MNKNFQDIFLREELCSFFMFGKRALVICQQADTGFEFQRETISKYRTILALNGITKCMSWTYHPYILFLQLLCMSR